MFTNIKNKVLSKEGASDMVVILIIIVIFSSVAFFVFKNLGKKTQDAGAQAGDQMTSTVTSATDYSQNGIK